MADPTDSLNLTDTYEGPARLNIGTAPNWTPKPAPVPSPSAPLTPTKGMTPVMSQMPVVDPDGNPGVIPREDWDKAAQQGFKKAVFATSPDGKLGILHPDDAVTAIQQHGFKLGQPAAQKGMIEGSDEWYMSKLPEAMGKSLAWLNKWYAEPINKTEEALKEVGGEFAATMADPAWVKREDNPYATPIEVVGAARGAGRFAGGMASPLNIPFFAMGGPAVRASLKQLVAAGFAANMSKGTVDAAQHLVNHWDEMNPEQRSQYVTEMGLGGVVTAMATKHALDMNVRPLGDIADRAKTEIAQTRENLSQLGQSRPVQAAKEAVQGVRAAWNPEKNLTPEQAATKAFRPRNAKSNWKQEISSALPDMKRAAEQRGVDTENMTLQEALQSVTAAKKDVWREYEQNHLDPAKPVQVPVQDVANAIRAKITDRMAEQNPGLAKKIDYIARTYDQRNLSVEQLQERVSQLNNETRSIEARYVTDKRAAKLDPDNAYKFAERDTLRSLLDQTLEETGGEGGDALRKRWGALTSVEDVISRRIPVADRKNPVSLTRIFELLHGPGRIIRGIAGGGLGDIAMGTFNTKAMMNAEKMNNPDWLTQQAFKKTEATPPWRPREVYEGEYVGPKEGGALGEGIPFAPQTRGMLPEGGGWQLPPASRIYGRPETPIVDLAEQNRQYGSSITPLGPTGKGGVMVRPKGLLPPGPPEQAAPPAVPPKTATKGAKAKIPPKAQTKAELSAKMASVAPEKGAGEKSAQTPQQTPAGATYYHGTNNAESIRSKGFSTQGEGSPYIGDNYAEGVFLSKSKEPFAEGGQLEGVQDVLPTKVSAKNIKTVDGARGVLQLQKQYGISSLDENASQKLTAALKKDGYEGLDTGNEVVIFDPKKVQLSESSSAPAKGVESVPPKAPTKTELAASRMGGSSGAAPPSTAILPPADRAAPVETFEKQPWEYTQKEWFDHKWAQIPKKAQQSVLAGEKGFASESDIRQQADNEHSRNVEQAIKSGQPVPPEVLKDYPDLEKFLPPSKRAEAKAEPAEAPKEAPKPTARVQSVPGGFGVVRNADGKILERFKTRGKAEAALPNYTKADLEANVKNAEETLADATDPTSALGPQEIADARAELARAKKALEEAKIPPKAPTKPVPEAKVSGESYSLEAPPEDIGVRQWIQSLPKEHQEYAKAAWDAIKDKGKQGLEDVYPNEHRIDEDTAGKIDRHLVGILDREAAKTPTKAEPIVPPKAPTRIGKLIDKFEDALKTNQLPTDPRDVRAMAKEAVGGNPSEYIDDIYDSLEGAVNRRVRDAMADLKPKTLRDRIRIAEDYENALGNRTRSLEITKLQQFSTPLTISQAAAYAADVKPGDRVLEPTAGTGNLIEPVRDKANVFTVEFDPRRAEILKANGYPNVVTGDFLQSKVDKMDEIITNPPWGKMSTGRYAHLNIPSPWGRFGDVSERFFLAAANRLNDGGRISAVMPTTILDASAGGFRKWMDQNGTVRALVQSPPNAYNKRGTSVDSVLLVWDKGVRGSTDNPTINAVGSNQPKDWDQYAKTLEPLSNGGSYARTTDTTEKPSEAAPLGSETPARPTGGTPRTGSERGLSGERGPGAGTGAVRPEPAGMGANVVSAPPMEGAVDGPGASGEPELRPATRLVRQSTRALRPEGVAAQRAAEFDEASNSPVFAPYVLRSGVRRNPHPRQVVETRSLAGAPAPVLTYQPGKSVTDAHERGVISDEQHDVIAAVGQASEHGHGYLAADDVGVGKSREIAGTMLDWLEKGKAKRILYTSKGEVNLRDFEQEAKIVAGVKPDEPLPFKVVYLRDFPQSSERGSQAKEYQPLPKYDNAVYLVESNNLTPFRKAISELEVDGLLADEAHTYKNEDAAIGETWKALHRDWMGRKIPMAYFTATPATTLDDLQYLYGLREWSLDGFHDWVERMTGHATKEEQEARNKTELPDEQSMGTEGTELVRGQKRGFAQKQNVFSVRVSTAEMEQVMRELKMKGKYGSRDLWRGGVEFNELEKPLTEEEKTAFAKAVNFARDAGKAYYKWKRMNKASVGFGPAAQLQAAMKRKLFDLRLTRAIEAGKEALDRGEQPVISLINVNPTKEGQGNIYAAMGNINVRHVEVDKESGEVTDLGEIPEAVAEVNELLERAKEEFGDSPDPIKLIQDAFGKDKVSIVTGAQNAELRRKAMDEFQKGVKPVAVISGAGKTGISLHHILETDTPPANGRRHLIEADYEWSATNFKQELGRVDRAGQISPPKITALTLGSAAEKKFIATITNRMKSLGAVSKGAAESTGTQALEHFELGGDTDNLAMRNAWLNMPYDLKKWFTGNKFNEMRQDGTPVPRHTISGVDLRDFLLQLQLIPIEEGNQIWNEFWKQREELNTEGAMEESAARKTQKLSGQILRRFQLAPDLEAYDVRDEGGHKAIIVSGLVTEHMPVLRQFIQADEWSQRTHREYTTFSGDNGEQISGLRMRPGVITPLAKAFGQKAVYEHTPESALNDIRAGDRVPLMNGWELRMGKSGEKRGYIIIEGARLSNTDRGKSVMPHGAKYNAVSGGFFYLPEDGSTLQQFLERFPIQKQTSKEAQSAISGEKEISSNIPPKAPTRTELAGNRIPPKALTRSQLQEFNA